MITRPMLATAIEDLKALKYPILLTKKIDGIRNLIIDNQAVSRNFKKQPNVFIREWLSSRLPSGLDGELVLKGDKKFNDIQSEVMSFEGEPDFEYWVFDYVKDSLTKPYSQRMEDLKEWYSTLSEEIKNRIKLVLPIKAENEEELLQFEEKCLTSGYEGVMIRSPEGSYKEGRSTIKQGYLIKLKRFSDNEAMIIGFEERMHNANEQKEDEFGLAKRASCKANMVPTGTLGALIVQNELGTFNIGSGFDDQLRKEIWENQDKYLGQICTYKFQKSGMKEDGLPRFPIYKSLRTDL